jgi:hypothetical protein
MCSARLARGSGIRGEAFNQRALGAAARKEQGADLGGVFRLHRQIRRQPQLCFGRLARRPFGSRLRGDLFRQRHGFIGVCRPQSEQDHRLQRRARIDRKPRAHRSAGGIVDLLDQARGQLDELPLLVGAVRVGLDIEVGQDAQQRRANVDALATRQCDQPVETRNDWSCAHGTRTPLLNMTCAKR